jgi:hypothetical protein
MQMGRGGGGRSICLGLLSGASLYPNDLQLLIIMPKYVTHKLSVYSDIMLGRFIAHENSKLCRNVFSYWVGGGALLMMMWRNVVVRISVAFVDKLFVCRRKIEYRHYVESQRNFSKQTFRLTLKREQRKI